MDSAAQAAPVEPAEAVLAALSARLLDPASPLPLKYRVMYSLRNLPGEDARRILATGAPPRHPSLPG